MKNMSLRIAAAAALAVAPHLPAFAQTGATPQQIQGLIAQGQENTALSDLQVILQSHPQSGVAWYLTAEAQDARGDEGAARSALAKADQFAPGLPFAQPNEVAALRAHLNGGSAPAQAGYTPPARHFSPIMVIGGFVLLFLLARMFMRARRRMMPGYPMNPGNPVGPYGPNMGPGGMPYGGGMMGGGGGIGGSILGGLAAGAGFAGGERIIDGMMGGNRGIDPNGNADPTADPGLDPSRDDGLNGSPGWDDNSGGGGGGDGGFDPGNNW